MANRYVILCYLSAFVCNVVCFNVTILHTNDVHARFLQFNKYGTDCSENDSAEGKCFGGVARRATKIKEIRNTHENVILLDAGDQFLGTLWFTVYKGRAASHFMNRLGYDVMCLGNHEFDLSVGGLANFLNDVNFDVVSANTDVTMEPRLKGRFVKSVIKNLDGGRVGIIGYITEETKFISTPGNTVKFSDVLNAVEREVSVLSGQGVTKIIALGHAGYTMDKLVAEIEGVDVVVGGHTDTFLYTGPVPSGEEPKGPYPTVVQQEGGNMALVVQDYTWGKYIGYLNIQFDSDGHVIGYNGNPILLDANVTEDADEIRELGQWQSAVNALTTQTVGYSNVVLDGERKHCRLRECNLGNLITDAVIDYHLNYTHTDNTWGAAAIAIINGGGIRASIDKGTVTAGEVINVLPFGSTIDVVSVTGQNLLDQLELSVSTYNAEEPHGRFLQVSGLKVVYNLNKPVGRRVISLGVRCLKCNVPSYSKLKMDHVYSIFVNSFMLGGGDGYDFQPKERHRFNTLDSDTLMDYIRRHSPVYASEEGRITFHTTGMYQISASQKQQSQTMTQYFANITLRAEFCYFINLILLFANGNDVKELIGDDVTFPYFYSYDVIMSVPLQSSINNAKYS